MKLGPLNQVMGMMGGPMAQLMENMPPGADPSDVR